jgi:hypothetical protein
MAPRKPKIEPEIISLASMLGMEETIEIIQEEYKPVKLSPFDFLNEISYGKNNIIVDDDTERQYEPFVVNKGLSQSRDAVQYMNYMNCRPHIPKKAQFLFLLNIIPKRKRYDKWAKAEENPDLDMVMEFYNYSREKALSIMKILSSDDLLYIKQKMFKGGISE